MTTAKMINDAEPICPDTPTGTPTGTAHLIDDDPAILDLAAAHLAAAGVEIARYASAEAFLAAADGAGVADGCVLLDLDLPGMGGAALHAELTRRGLPLAVVVLSGTRDVGEAVGMMKRGALDVIRKPFTGEVLVAGVRDALAEGAEARRRHDRLAEVRGRYATLTPRERQVMGFVARGYANKQVAYDLKLSERTIEVHRARVNQKMRAESVAELVAMAGDLGLAAPALAA